MFFVHPQIRFQDIPKAKLAFLKRAQTKKLMGQFSSWFPNKQIVFTDMGRTAFRIIVEKLNLANTSLLMPAYICDIFLPILKEYNIRPIFLDINLNTFNIDPENIVGKIESGTKAILVSHTYGLLADVGAIRNILAKSAEVGPPQIKIIEDCAHIFNLRTHVGGRTPYVLGDVAFFSLYKQIPALRGGMLVCPRTWELDLPKTRFSLRDIISLLNSVPVYAWFFKKFGSAVAYKMLRKEKLSKPAGINRVSLNLFQSFLPDFEKSLAKRKNRALFLQNELKQLGFRVQESADNVFCYVSALVPEHLTEKRNEIVQALKKYDVFCTRIWHTPIILNPEAQQEYNINVSDFPSTISAAKRIINFPLQNYYSKFKIQRMILLIKKTLTDLTN